MTWSGSLDFFISAQEKKTAKLKANVCVVTQEVLTCWVCYCCSWQKSFFVPKFLQQNVKNFKNCDLGKFLKQTIGNYQLKKMCWNMTFFFFKMKFMDSTHGWFAASLHEAIGFCASTRRVLTWPFDPGTRKIQVIPMKCFRPPESNFCGGGKVDSRNGGFTKGCYDVVKNPIFCLNVWFWVD